MRAFLFIIILLVYKIEMQAQQSVSTIYELSGTFYNEQQQAIPDAIIQLLNSSDSSLVKTEFTNEKGQFKFTDLNNGAYFIQSNVLGYKKYISGIIPLIQSVSLDSIVLLKNDVKLDEVIVTSRKPSIERENGKMIVNVENSISSTGSSAFEIIEKSPGVRVDNNDNIAYNGRNGITVWIDGKVTPMTGSDLANYLRGIPSTSIEKIEFIANPSAKYDAAGSSIINIKLKKDKRQGTNGSISLAYGQGIYPKSNNSFNINHRNKKVNVYGNYSYAYREAFSTLNLKRNFYRNDTFIGAYKQDNLFRFDFSNHIARAGVDYYANDKNIFGIVVNGISNKFNPKGDNFSDVYNSDDVKVSRFATENRSNDHWYNYSTNINHKHIFDSTGTELNTDLDYAQFGNNTTQNFTTRYYDLNNTEYTNPYLLHGDITGSLNIYSIKSDFNKTLKNNMKFETGIKSSYVKADNNLAYYNQSNHANVYDSSKSNHFIYQENINAAYVNANKTYKKFNFQLGLRAEHTHVTGNQLVYHSKFDTNYVQLFPSALAGYKITNKHSLEVNYSRRINRPSYQQLNPFKFYLDPSTYKEGNPYLKPQVTVSFELTHIFKQNIYTTLGYGRTKNNITEVLAPAEHQDKLTIQTFKNLQTVDVYALNISVPIEVTKWWHTTTDVNVYYGLYSGNIANTQIKNVGNVNFNINTVNTFNFTQTFSGELSGNYRARELYAYENVNPIWFLNIGLQKKIMNNNGTIKFNFTDIFFSNKIKATTTFDNYIETFNVSRDTRVATIAFTYKFGKNSIAPARRRQGGADDIKQRAGGNGVG